MRLQFETETMADLIFEFFNFFALELDYFFAILADDMIVMRVLGVIWIIEFVILAEVHFANETAFSEQREGAVNGSPRNRWVSLTRPFQ